MIRWLSLAALVVSVGAAQAQNEDPWVVYKGDQGPGKGKKIVLISGDEEYRSEEMLPQLAKILAKRHGFDCTVLFAIDPKDGTINPGVTTNIPGTEALANADLMVIFTRFRNLPPAQMKPIVDFVESGKPVVGLRTATHGFSIPKGKQYDDYSWNNKGGFGKKVLGETWVNHHGAHGSQATRGIIAKDAAKHPILKGIKNGDVFGPSDVYTVNLGPDCTPLILGEVVKGMKTTDPALDGKKNDPMMPVAWTRINKTASGKEGRVFTTTTANGQDFVHEGTRRMTVNGILWALGMEDQIPASTNVDIVGTYEPLPFRGGGHKKGVRPADLQIK